MLHYRVTYLARKNGALGVYRPKVVAIGGAASVKIAVHAAFDQLHDLGFETLHPVLVERVDWADPETGEYKAVDVTAEARS